MTRRRLLATLVGVATTVTAAAGGAYGGSAPDDAPTGPLAAEMAAALEQQPGGVQVSDNAMVWDDGAIVVVWPSPGDAAAPFGLGANVRRDVAEALGLEDDVQSRGGVTTRGSASSCPIGYYCFYTEDNWDGLRFQYSSTCSGSAPFDLNNKTTSWVNRNYDKRINAYDTAGGTLLWTMGAGKSSANVGAADDNRMSAWTCTYL
jgi:hypothetical protein